MMASFSSEDEVGKRVLQEDMEKDIREVEREVEDEEEDDEEKESDESPSQLNPISAIKEANDILVVTPLAKIASKISSRSGRSHTDGYSHYHDEEKQPASSHGGAPAEDEEFEVAFDGDSDPANPKSKPRWRKWLIVIIGAMCSVVVTCASALYTTAYNQLEKDFHISRELATAGLTTYVMGLGLGPMFLSPLSEFYGRRIVFICSFGMFTIWLIPCAVAPEIISMLIFRFLDGLSGSAFLSVAGGVVGDMFTKETLSAPMIVFTASPFFGPILGPIAGGFINQFISWRWSFWVLAIWAGIQWILIIAFVPETYAPVLLRRKAVKLRKETGDDRWYAPIEKLKRSVLGTVVTSCYRPFQLLFLEQMCLNLCLLSALLLGILYLFFGAFPVVFERNYGFNEWQTGLAFLGIFVGMLIGTALDPIGKKNYSKLVRQNDGISEPEFRLPPTIVGALFVPVSLFGFGWTTYPWIHWIVPIIFSSFFGLGIILCFGGVFTFLVECYPLYAASALAANSFARSIFGAAFPLFGVQMYDNLDDQWASSLLGFIALAMTPFPPLFFKFGKKLRGRSRFARAP